MNQRRSVGIALAIGWAGILAGCASHPPSHLAMAGRTSVQPAPQTLAEPREGAHAVAAINRDIGPGETVWHLRSALNVAALQCRSKSLDRIAVNYNRMLRRHRAVLADAYSEEEARFRAKFGRNWQHSQDRHLTSLYNFFANPVATRQFCAAAMTVSTRINDLEPGQLKDYSAVALAQLERPIVQASALARR